jgi:hypothetical protein
MRFGLVLLALLFFTLKLFANSSLPTCSMQNICEQFRDQQDHLYFYVGDEETKVPNFRFLKTHSEEYENSEDPFLNPQLFQKLEFQKSYQEASLRAEKVFLETQAGVLKFLARKRNHFSKAEYKDFTNRVKTVRLSSVLDPRIQKIAAGACRRPNAIYIREMHELLVCPSLMNMPDLTLQKILAHEFGHSIQKVQDKISCFEQFPHRQIDEAFADWVSSEVIAANIRAETNKGVAKKKALESQMLFLSIACFSHETAHSYSYPTIQNRVEKIFLAQSALQDAFQCQNPNVPHCE